MAGKFNKLNLGAGLLSEASKQLATNEFQIVFLPYDSLIPNEKNEGFSMNEIEELKTSILEVGLQQNFVVKKSPDKPDYYIILSGHRRHRAVTELVQEGHDEFKMIPCVVKDLAKIDLPLDEETKEIYAIATTNAEVRKNTDADRLKLMEMLSLVYDKLKAQGYSRLGKRREFIAERLGVSSSSVKILSFIDKNISGEFRDDFENDKLSLTVANEIAHLDEKAQKKLRKQTDDASLLSVDSVKSFADKEKKRAEAKTAQSRGDEDNKHSVTKADFSYLKDLNNIVGAIQEPLTVDSATYKKLRAANEKIAKQQEVIYSILESLIAENE